MRRPAAPVTEIQAPSSAAESSRLRKIVCRLAWAALRSPRAVSDVELAVGEAFSNAVKHGEHDAKVSVRLETSSGRRLSVEMVHPGPRFDTKLTRPSDVQRATGGFGRSIIQQTMDDAKYSFRNGLTTLCMVKRR